MFLAIQRQEKLHLIYYKGSIMTTNNKGWLTPKDVQKEFGFSTSTLAKWRMLNLNLAFSKMGKYIRYSRADIEEFIESNKVEVAL